MPICTLVDQLQDDGTFQFSYTAEDGQVVELGRFGIVLAKLLTSVLENPSVQIPTMSDRTAAPHPGDATE